MRRRVAAVVDCYPGTRQCIAIRAVAVGTDLIVGYIHVCVTVVFGSYNWWCRYGITFYGDILWQWLVKYRVCCVLNLHFLGVRRCVTAVVNRYPGAGQCIVIRAVAVRAYLIVGYFYILIAVVFCRHNRWCRYCITFYRDILWQWLIEYRVRRILNLHFLGVRRCVTAVVDRYPGAGQCIAIRAVAVRAYLIVGYFYILIAVVFCRHNRWCRYCITFYRDVLW